MPVLLAGDRKAEVHLRTNYLIAFLLGVIATMLGVLVFGKGPQPAFAQTVEGGAGYVAATSNYFENGGRNQLWLLNATEKGAPKLCLYEAREGRFSLVFARNLTYDFMYDQYPARADAQVPSVQEVFNETKKKRDDAQTPKGEKPAEKPK